MLRIVLLVMTSCLCIAILAGVVIASEDAPRITKEQLKSLLGDTNLIIIDVRQGPDWNDSDAKIKGAVRESPVQLDAWKDKYPRDSKIILY